MSAEFVEFFELLTQLSDLPREVGRPLLFLCDGASARIQEAFSHRDHRYRPLVFLSTNGRGAMMRAHLKWGTLTSRYDALLAANMNTVFPEDRWIMLTRCRIWVVYQGVSQEVGPKNLKRFRLRDHQTGEWQYHVPTGQGEHIVLASVLQMAPGANVARLTVTPLRFHPLQQELEVTRRLLVEVRFDVPQDVSAMTAAAQTSPVDRLLRSALLNGETASSWKKTEWKTG